MEIPLDKILREYIEHTFDAARLMRDWNRLDQNAAFSKALAELEKGGNAMRYLDRKGRIAWKATPRLRDLINDLWRDAQADAEEEDA